MGKADTHIHTEYSGFSYLGVMKFPESVTTPEQQVEKARKNGMDVLGITDHDETKGAFIGQKYAERYDMKFISTGNFLGDVNSDGEINIKDATAIQSYLAGLTNLTDFEKTAADIDGNGEINVVDATTLQKKLANII